MKIYTKTGDDGSTGLYGGERVPKDHPRVVAYGSVDECNALLGVVRAHLDVAEVNADLAAIQNALFDLGADLATPGDARQRDAITPIDDGDVAHLEALIDRYSDQLEPLRHFILPGGCPAAASLQVARAVARRAEREVVTLARGEPVNDRVLVYLNRLSDLLFTLARLVNARAGVSEVTWRVKERPRPGAAGARRRPRGVRGSGGAGENG